MPTEYPQDNHPRHAVAPGSPGNGRSPTRSPTGPGRPQRGPGGVVGILHVIGGNDRGKQFPLTQPQTAVGRGADQDFILADIAVSRRHIVILIDGERYRMKDLGSGNGTLINGVRTDTVLLNDGDQIEIGNTLLRLEHPPSRAQAQAPLQAPQLTASPDNRTMMADAVSYPAPMPVAPPPSYPPPSAYAAPAPAPVAYAQPMSVPQPLPPPGHEYAQAGSAGSGSSDAIALPYPQRPPTSALPAPLPTGMHPSPGGLLDTTFKKVAVFGTIFLVVALGAAVVVKKFVLSGGDEGQKLYVEGQRVFQSGDYAKAKQLFGAAVNADPNLVQAAKALNQCNVEINAHSALKTATGLAAQKRWKEELQQLDTIDRSSEAHKQAEEMKREAIPHAVDDLLKDARDVAKDDPDQALAKIDEALLLDSENEEAQKLEKQIKASQPAAPASVATADKDSSRTPRPGKKDTFALIKDDEEARPSRPVRPAPATPRPAAPPPVKKPVVARDDDEDLAPVTPRGTPAPAAGGGAVDVLTSKAAGPYKSKDFAGAAAALKGLGSGGAVLAARVSVLANSYNKAEAAKASNPQVAVTEYQQAMAIDNAVGKGTHAAYFKAQLGKMYKQLAQQAFQQQKFDVAFDASKNCSKFGSDDGGIGAQLKTKAADFNARAAAIQKSNLNQAKTMWRTVLKMVPNSDPNYVKAAQALNASQATHTDEDE